MVADASSLTSSTAALPSVTVVEKDKGTTINVECSGRGRCGEASAILCSHARIAFVVGAVPSSLLRNRCTAHRCASNPSSLARRYQTRGVQMHQRLRILGWRWRIRGAGGLWLCGGQLRAVLSLAAGLELGQGLIGAHWIACKRTMQWSAARLHSNHRPAKGRSRLDNESLRLDAFFFDRIEGRKSACHCRIRFKHSKSCLGYRQGSSGFQHFANSNTVVSSCRPQQVGRKFGRQHAVAFTKH